MRLLLLGNEYMGGLIHFTLEQEADNDTIVAGMLARRVRYD